MKKKRKSKNNGKDLRYRMRQKGYEIIVKSKLVILPADDRQRSLLMERRIQKEFKYQIQYHLL